MKRAIPTDLGEIGSRFAAFRLSRNITQDQLAAKAGISRSTLARLETSGGATLETVLRVLHALDLEDRLFLLVPDAKPSPLDPHANDRQRARQKQTQPSARTPRWGDEA